MLLVLRRGGRALEKVESSASWSLPDDAVWIELVNPTREEELAVEAAVGVDLPTREEMAEIEVSSRLYQEHGATFMIATVLCGSDSKSPFPGPVTFVLVGDRLLTIRYVEPRAFAAFTTQVVRQPDLSRTGVTVLLGLLEAIIDRTADVLERVSAEVEETSRTIFTAPGGAQFRPILNELAASHSVNGKARESLVSLARLISFAMLANQIEQNREARDELRSMQRDAQSLTEHASYVSGNLTFLLDAALGLISVDQNEITKLFSIFAVVLLPPTLISSWYGMNFKHMPELEIPLMYPLVLLCMLLSAVIPFLWIKRKGWI